MRFLVVPLIVASAAFATAAPAAAKAGDQAFAEAAVLTEADVPSGFTGGPFSASGDDPPLPECKGAIAKADQKVESSPIARSGFQLDGPSGYAVIENVVAVLPTEKQAKKAMKAYADDDAAEACTEARFVESFTESGVTVDASLGSFAPELDDKGSTRVIDGGDEFLGFGGSVRRSAGGAPQLFEVEVVLARDGRAVTRILFVTQGTIPQDDAQQMLQAVVSRMGSA